METKAHAEAVIMANAVGLLYSLVLCGLLAWSIHLVRQPGTRIWGERPMVRKLTVGVLGALFGVGVLLGTAELVLTIGWFNIWRAIAPGHS